MKKQIDTTEMKRKAITVLKFAAVAAIFAVAVFNYDSLKNLDVRLIAEQAPSMAVAVSVILGIYIAKALTMVVPASVIYISVGMAYPAWQALLINFTGICLEVMATYLLGRFLGGEKVEEMLRSKKGGEKLLSLRQRGSYAFVFLLRFSPAPLDLSSLFLGASRFPIMPYFLMSVSGTMPRVAALTVLGYGLYEFIPMEYIVTAVIVAIPLVAAGLFIRGLVRRRRNGIEEYPDSTASAGESAE